MLQFLGIGNFSADSGKVSVQFLDLLPGWASSAVLLISQPGESSSYDRTKQNATVDIS
jgi:hypothetical protein